MSEESCPSCGSSKETNGPEWELRNDCPQCGSQKCSACDMGDDVECLCCTEEEEEEEEK